MPLAADSFPAPDPSAAVVAISLGHLGWRTDWALLRAVAERMPELVLLLVGAWHDDESKDDPDYAACRSAPNLVWLGAQDDEAAARLILCADVGIVPFKVEPFNDAGLPYRILKYARLGRRTITPPLAGVATWQDAVTVAPDADAFVAALRASAGARTQPDDAAARVGACADRPQPERTTLGAPSYPRRPWLSSRSSSTTPPTSISCARCGWRWSRHHGAITPDWGPVRDDDDSWTRRRADYVKWLAEPDAFCLVAACTGQGTILGYALVTVNEGSPTWASVERFGYVESLSVLPEARGTGVGSALLRAAEDQLATLGVEQVNITTVAANENARRFYEREGYEAAFITLQRRTRRTP